MNIDLSPLGRMLHRSFARYLSVTARGLRFPDGALRITVPARIQHAHPTRTFYRDKKPVCRSLDGFTPLRPELAAHCAECSFRERCTAQLNLQLTVEGVPFNVLLSYTSLKNFLCFRANLSRPLEQMDLTLTVLDRGRWGELTFLAKG